uniref:C2H2-type domain-containing protein n=1 Tax=Chenopodium quinoa TaxID=63459 RepID=A0A803N012_CHEQI
MAASGKKRPNADAKTPESKKAKLVTPQKTDGKKGAAHTATPHPSKKGGKTPGDKSASKSAGSVSCDSCKKTFNSDVALQSHNKAKHSAK